MRPQISETYERINEFLNLMRDLGETHGNMNVTATTTTIKKNMSSSIPIVSGIVTGTFLIGAMLFYGKRNE